MGFYSTLPNWAQPEEATWAHLPVGPTLAGRMMRGDLGDPISGHGIGNLLTYVCTQILDISILSSNNPWTYTQRGSHHTSVLMYESVRSV